MARLLRQGYTDEEASAQLSGLFVCEEGPDTKTAWDCVLVPNPVTAEDSEGTLSGSAKPSAMPAPHRIPQGECGYVVSLVKRGKTLHRKLHYVGQCHLVPGIDYIRFLWLGPSKPEADNYDSVCTRCRPTGHQDSTSSCGSGSEDEK